MDSIFDTFLGLILGAIFTYWIYTFFRKKKSKEITEHQSTVLLEKIRSVCKLVFGGGRVCRNLQVREHQGIFYEFGGQ